MVVVSAMGKTTNKLLAIADAAIKGKRDDYIQQLHDLRDFHSREARHGGAARPARRARPHARRAFPGAHRTGEGPGGARRTDAALDRRHLELRGAALQLHRHPGLPALRDEGRARRFAPCHHHRQAPHAGRAEFPRDLRAPDGHHPAAGAGQRRGHGRLHRRPPRTA